MSFVKIISLSPSNLLYLVQAEEANQKRPAWYYVQVDKLKLPLLKQKLKTASSILEFGKIMFSGWGENPPEDIRRKIQEEYA